MSDVNVNITEQRVKVTPVEGEVVATVEVNVPGLQGPQGEPGAPGPQGEPGTGGDKNFSQAFTFSDDVTVVHNLGKYPSVDIFDSAGTEVIGNVEYIDQDRVRVTFTNPFTGMIILN